MIFVNIIEELKLEAYLLERKAIQLIKESLKLRGVFSSEDIESIKT
jgi:hypothetical protein